MSQFNSNQAPELDLDKDLCYFTCSEGFQILNDENEGTGLPYVLNNLIIQYCMIFRNKHTINEERNELLRDAQGKHTFCMKTGQIIAVDKITNLFKNVNEEKEKVKRIIEICWPCRYGKTAIINNCIIRLIYMMMMNQLNKPIIKIFINHPARDTMKDLFENIKTSTNEPWMQYIKVVTQMTNRLPKLLFINRNFKIIIHFGNATDMNNSEDHYDLFFLDDHDQFMGRTYNYDCKVDNIISMRTNPLVKNRNGRLFEVFKDVKPISIPCYPDHKPPIRDLGFTADVIIAEEAAFILNPLILNQVVRPLLPATRKDKKGQLTGGVRKPH